MSADPIVMSAPPSSVPDRAVRTRGLRHVLRPSSLVYGVVLVLLAVTVALPIAGILWQSLRDEDGFSLASYVEFFQSSRLLRATLNTFLVGVANAVGSVIVATVLAFGVARTGMWGKRLVRTAIIIAFASPAFLMTLSYILLAGPNNGLVNQWIRTLFGLETEVGPLNIFSLWGFVFLALPSTVALVFVIMLPAFASMDPSLEEASRIAGAGPVRTIASISLPVMRPGMLAGALLSFSTALALFATPYILGLDVLTVSMRRSILIEADFSAAAAIAAVSAVLSLSVMVLYRRSIQATLQFQTIKGKGQGTGGIDVGRGRHFFTAFGIVFSFLAAIVPYTVMLVISLLENPYVGFSQWNFTLEHYRFVFEYDLVRRAIRNSLILGITAALIIAAMGFLLSYLVTRTNMRGRAIADYVSVLPLGIAGTAFAVGVIVIHLQTPVKHLALYGTIWILLIAYVGRYLPWGVRAAQVSLLQVSRELEEASRVGGATELQTLRLIVAPLIRPGIAYAFILGMVQAFTEVSASALLVGSRVNVLATSLLTIYDGAKGLPRASAIGVFMFVATMVMVVIAQRVGGRSLVDSDASR